MSQLSISMPFFLSLLLCLLISTASTSMENDDFQLQGEEDADAEQTAATTTTTTIMPEIDQSPMAQDAPRCDVHENESLHALMDRICELCHDLYSHQKPNTRAECRSNCFRSISFKRCIRLFKPMGGPKGNRRKLQFIGEGAWDREEAFIDV